MDSRLTHTGQSPAVRSLFLLPFRSNPGYAITPLETLFYQTGLDLALGDSSCVHFGYCDFLNGPPKALPPDFANLLEFNLGDIRTASLDRLAAYLKQNAIKLVLIFDIQPVHHLFQVLRESGVDTILAYIGAPISSFMPTWKLMLKKVEVSISRSKLDGMIFESRAMADLAVYGRGVPQRMIDIVPLGVDINLFSSNASQYAYHLLRLPPNRKIVIYSGHMERRKGVHVLIKAAIDLLVRRRRDDVCFLICGNRNNDECREYTQMYAGLGLDALIKFGGYRSDMNQLYQSCFCGVVPSAGWDSFPRSSLEMAASGLPVVAARLGGLPEAVIHQATGLLFEPGHARELADCLELLLEFPDQAAQYGRCARVHCETQLSLQAQRDRFKAALLRHVRREDHHKDGRMATTGITPTDHSVRFSECGS